MTPPGASMDVFKKVRRHVADAGKDVKMADLHPLSSPERILHMKSAMQHFRAAAHEIETNVTAEEAFLKDGVSVYQMDFEGAATPILVS